MAQGVELTGYRPGGLGKVIELRGRYYGAEWNFDIAFEADIATDLTSFLIRYATYSGSPDPTARWLVRSPSTVSATTWRVLICAGSSGSPAPPAAVLALR